MEPWQAPGPGEDRTTHLDLPRSGYSPSPHPWYAIRDEALALLAATLALDPGALANPRLSEMAGQLDYLGVRSVLDADLGGRRAPTTVYDFCSGVGTLAAAAAALGCDASAIELEPVAVLVSRAINTFSAESSITQADLAAGWGGLSREISEGTSRILTSAHDAVRQSDDIALTSQSLLGRLWARCYRCQQCGQYVPVVADARIADDLFVSVRAGVDQLPVPELVRSADPDSFRTWRKGRLTCMRCNTNERVRPSETAFATPLVDLFVDDAGQLQPSPAAVAILDFKQQLGAHPSRSPSKPLDDPRSIWGWRRDQRDPIYVATACLPSQRRFLSAASLTLEREIGELPTELPADRRDALACSLSLVLSAVMPDLSTFAGWNPRIKRPRRGVRALGWIDSSPFFEAGIETIERWCSDSAARLGRRIDGIASRLSRPVSVRVADAAATGLPERSADVVLWDPPVYDNIDYRALARPHELMLENLAGILPADIAPKNHRTRHGFEHPTRFDKSEYEAQITAQAEEAIRVLRGSGRLAVFWPARAPADLQKFLDRIAPAGFELEQALRISRGGESFGDVNRTYVLLLKAIADAARSSHSQVDAARVLELADEDRPALNHGLADILLRRMVQADIDDMIPTDTRGTREDRLAEHVASHSDPADFLAELGRGELREELADRGIGIQQTTNKTTRQLANLLLEELGFEIPQAPKFSVKDTLDEAKRALNDLQYATSMDAAQGSAGTCFIQIERALRYSVVAWSKMPESSEDMLRSVMEDHGRTFNVGRLSFGDWKFLFTQVPQALRDSNPGVGVFIDIARAMRQGRLDDKLSAVIRARNDIHHDRDPTATGDTVALIRRVTDAVRDAVSTLAELDARRLLPITATPQEEIRDRFGRRRLVLADTDANRIEVFVKHETDLSRPLVYIASGSNPRDVNPTLIPAQNIEAFLSATS
jgi:hypothetical protein